MKLPASVRKEFQQWGAIGGRKAKHALSPEKARAMGLASAARRAKIIQAAIVETPIISSYSQLRFPRR